MPPLRLEAIWTGDIYIGLILHVVVMQMEINVASVCMWQKAYFPIIYPNLITTHKISDHFKTPFTSAYYAAPDRGAEYCDEHVCLCVCVCMFVCPWSCLQNYTSDLHQIFVHVTYACGSVLLWRRRDTLCTSGFMDDVIFVHKPRQLNVAARLMEAQPTCSLILGCVVNGA